MVLTVLGGTAGAMGNLYVANGTTVNATGGNAGSSGGTGGGVVAGIYDGWSYNVYCGRRRRRRWRRFRWRSRKHRYRWPRRWWRRRWSRGAQVLRLFNCLQCWCLRRPRRCKMLMELSAAYGTEANTKGTAYGMAKDHEGET